MGGLPPPLLMHPWGRANVHPRNPGPRTGATTRIRIEAGLLAGARAGAEDQLMLLSTPLSYEMLDHEYQEEVVPVDRSVHTLSLGAVRLLLLK